MKGPCEKLRLKLWSSTVGIKHQRFLRIFSKPTRRGAVSYFGLQHGCVRHSDLTLFDVSTMTYSCPVDIVGVGEVSLQPSFCALYCRPVAESEQRFSCYRNGGNCQLPNHESATRILPLYFDALFTCRALANLQLTGG